MKQKKTILFGITNNFFKEQLSLISTELISRGYNVIILTNSKKVNSYFLINNPDVRSIYLPKAGRSLGLKYSDTALDKLFKKYNFDQEQFFFRETKILGRKKKCLRHYCFPILSYLDRFFEEEKIDYFVNCGEALSNIMMWRVSKKTNLEYFHTTWVGYIDNMHYWDSDLNRISWIKPEFLRKKRRHAIVIITVLASFLSPGDVVTVTVMMMAPLVLLYEFSILLSVLIYRRPEKREIGGQPPEDAVEAG